MLKRIRLRNYRAFDEVDIKLSKINLIFGPNNSGKSALISSVNLLAQTLESADLNVPLLLNGNRLDLGTYKDVVFNNDSRHSIDLYFEFSKSIPLYPSINGFFELNYSYRKRRREIILRKTKFGNQSRSIELKTISPQDGGTSHRFEISIKRKDKRKKEKIVGKLSLQHFIPFVSYVHFEERKKIDNHRGIIRRRFLRESHELRNILNMISNEFKKIEYLSPLREHPERTFSFAGESPVFVGKRGKRAIDILLMDYLKRGKGKKDLTKLVSKWFKKSEMADSVDINILTDRHFEIRISHCKTKELENLADVGFGCSQILPVLVSGYNQLPGNIFIVEQPEVHLHPKAQSELGSFFYDLYKNDIQTIIETHSEHLLLRLQSYVAKGLLDPSDIKIYYVYAKKDENKKISEIKLEKDGFFDIKQWPEGFFPERSEEVRKIAIPH